MVPQLTARPSEAIIVAREEAGRFHFAPLKFVTRSRLLFNPIPIGDETDNEARREYVESPPLQTLNTWGTTTWNGEEHRSCRSTHRYFVTPLSLTDFRFLSHHPCFTHLRVNSDVGLVWMSLCTVKGRAFNIQVANRIYRFSIPLIANLYEIVTLNDIGRGFIFFYCHTPVSYECIIGSVWLLNDFEIKCAFIHLTDPKSQAVDQPKKPQAYINHKGERCRDGGVRVTRYSGSHRNHLQEVYDVADDIIHSWSR